jgi:hypothetical protein
VATITLINQSIQLGGREYPCLWGYSFFSHPDFRSPGMGGLLIKELLVALKKRGIAFAAYGATPVATSLLEKLGMVNSGQAPRYLLPLRADPITQLYLSNKYLQYLATPVLNNGMQVWSTLLLALFHSAAKSFQLVEKQEFDSDLSFLSSRGHTSQIRCKRSALLLNWKLNNARTFTKAEYKIFYVFDDKGLQVGYFVIRIATYDEVGRKKFRNVRICRVLDMVVTTGTRPISAIFYFLLKIATSMGCDVLEIISTDNKVRTFCQKFGFLTSNGYSLVVTESENYPSEIFDINSWFLNMIESEPAFT